MLLTRILGGTTAAFAALCILLYIQVQIEKRSSAKWEKEAIQWKAAAQTCSENTERLEAESAVRTKAAAKALEAARIQTERAELSARELERERPLSGQCLTPPDVMGAGL